MGLNRFGHTFQILGGWTETQALIQDFLQDKLLRPDALACLAGVPLPQPVKDLYLGYCEPIDLARQRAKRCERQAIGALKGIPFETTSQTLPGAELLKLLETIPGVGPITASGWLAEVGSIHRFPDVKAATAWAGFDPSLKVSAGKVTAPIRRKGHKGLHALIGEAAGRVLRLNHPLGVWGKSIAAKHKKGG
jgi:transposase